MSNNKQSSINWFVEELTKQNMFMNLFLKEIEQAKAMHKEEMIDALLFGDVLSLNTAENYYNETFGGNK